MSSSIQSSDGLFGLLCFFLLLLHLPPSLFLLRPFLLVRERKITRLSVLFFSVWGPCIYVHLYNSSDNHYYQKKKKRRVDK